MTLKTRNALTKAGKARIRAELADAYDFDPRDPLFGLTRADHSARNDRTNLTELGLHTLFLASQQVVAGGVFQGQVFPLHDLRSVR